MVLKKKIILASASPRRCELLKMTGFEFEVFPVNADERIEAGMRPADAAQLLARRKAQLAQTSHPKAIIIGADTVVALDKVIFGKPANKSEAVHILKTLSGKTHQVYTGVTIVSSEIDETFVSCTSVRFFSLSEDEIQTYVQSGEPMDKAGAYGIQGMGRFLVETIHGNYDNVVGLPVAQLYRKLRTLSGR